MTRRQESLKPIFVTFVSRSITLGLNLLSGIFLARFLGPEGRGLYAYLLLFPEYASSLGGLGFHEAVTYHASLGKYKLNEIVGTTIAFSIILGIIYLLMINAMFIFGIISTKGATIIQTAIILAAIPFGHLNQNLGNFMRGIQDFLYFNIFNIFQAAIYLSGIIIALIIYKGGLSGSILAYLVAILSTALFATIYIFSKLKKSPRLNYDFLKEGLTFGIKIWMGTVSSILSRRIDFFLLPLIINVAALGQYAVATQIAEVLLIFPASISTVLMPKITVSKSLSYKIVSKWLKLQIIFFICAAIAYIFVGETFITIILGEQFIDAYKILIYLLPGILTLSLSTIFSSFFSGKGYPLINSYAAFSGLIFGMVAYLVLIPKFGALGAAIGSSISYSIQCGVQLIAYYRKGLRGKRFLFFLNLER